MKRQLAVYPYDCRRQLRQGCAAGAGEGIIRLTSMETLGSPPKSEDGTVLNSAVASALPDSQASVGAPKTWRIHWAAVATVALLGAIVIMGLALRFVGLAWG